MFSTISTSFNGLMVNTGSQVATTWAQLSSQAFLIAQPVNSTTYTTTNTTSYGTSTITYTNASVSTQIRKSGYYTFTNTGGNILFSFPSGLTQMNAGFSIGFFINISNSSTAYTLALLPAPSAYRWGFGIQLDGSINSNKLTVSTQYPSNQPSLNTVYENTKFVNNTWIHYTITYANDTGLVSLYKNGVLQSQAIQYSGLTNVGWYSKFGFYDVNSVYYFDGVYCFNRPLDPSEVSLLYANS